MRTWRASSFLLDIGWVCGGLGFYVFFDMIKALESSVPLYGMYWSITLGTIALPAMLVIDPATASSSCARLEDRITKLCIEDPNHAKVVDEARAVVIVVPLRRSKPRKVPPAVPVYPARNSQGHAEGE